jgi:DNA-binding response OmpR family regulator
LRRVWKLLVVDDDPTMLEVLLHAFEGEGFDVVTAVNGLEGVRKAREERPHLVFLNLLMPVMDGFEACRVLKADEATREIPVFIFSACSGQDYYTEAFKLGAWEYVTSPFNPREVANRIRYALGERTPEWERETTN